MKTTTINKKWFTRKSKWCGLGRNLKGATRVGGEGSYNTETHWGKGGGGILEKKRGLRGN